MKFCEKLMTGAPTDAGSHFRMILPLAWRESGDVACSGSRFQLWEEMNCDPLLTKRKKYFTYETATLLLENTLWLEPESYCDFPSETTVPFIVSASESRSVKVALSKPRLVIFEARARRKSEQDVDSPLHVAFMVIDASFPEAVTMSDFLTIAEVLRYWEEPFATLYQERGIGSTKDKKEDETIPWEHYTNIWGRAFALVKNVTYRNQHFTLSTPENADFPLKKYYADNRAFVCSFCHFVPVTKHDGQQNDEPLSKACEHATNSDWTQHANSMAPWIKLLNVDHHSGNSFSSSPFEADWAKNRTYTRWAHYGTLHGFTTHSYVWLYKSNSDSWNKEMSMNFLSHYTDLTLYCFYLRQVLMRFNAKLFNISSDLSCSAMNDRYEKIRSEYGTLRKQYLMFENLYRFPLLSTQQQPLEMYAIQQRELDVAVLYEEMSQQIQNSDEFFASLISENQAASLEKINYLVILSTVLSVISAVAALADLPDNIACTAFIGLLLGMILTCAAYNTKNFKNDI